MADQYHSFSIGPLSEAQFETFLAQYNAIDRSEASAQLTEWIADTGQLTISFGGADLTNLLTRMRTLFQSRLGRLPDSDASIAVGVKCATGRDSRGSR